MKPLRSAPVLAAWLALAAAGTPGSAQTADPFQGLTVGQRVEVRTTSGGKIVGTIQRLDAAEVQIALEPAAGGAKASMSVPRGTIAAVKILEGSAPAPRDPDVEKTRLTAFELGQLVGTILCLAIPLLIAIALIRRMTHRSPPPAAPPPFSGWQDPPMPPTEAPPTGRG